MSDFLDQYPDRYFVIDTSVDNVKQDPGLLKRTRDLKELSHLTSGIIEMDLRRLNWINDIVSSGRSIFIPQVALEINRYLEKLGANLTQLDKAKKEDREEEIKIDKIRMYSKSLVQMVRAGSNPTIQREIESNPELYAHYLDLARIYATRSQKARDSALETDQHVIASTFALSYHHDVLLITRDYGICAVLERINNDLNKNIRGLRKHGMPLFLPETYNPDSHYSEETMVP